MAFPLPEALTTAVGRLGELGERQADYARELCAGLPVEIRLQDYRQFDEEFDRIYSIAMFEHVGYKNYRTYMGIVRRNLRDDGLFRSREST